MTSYDAHVRTDLPVDEHREFLARAVSYHQDRADRLEGDPRQSEAQTEADQAQTDLDTWDKEHN